MNWAKSKLLILKTHLGQECLLNGSIWEAMNPAGFISHQHLALPGRCYSYGLSRESANHPVSKCPVRIDQFHEVELIFVLWDCWMINPQPSTITIMSSDIFWPYQTIRHVDHGPTKESWAVRHLHAHHHQRRKWALWDRLVVHRASLFGPLPWPKSYQGLRCRYLVLIMIHQGYPWLTMNHD